MAAELLQSSPAFRESMHACAKAVAPYGLDLLAEMVDPEGWKSSAASASGLASVQVLLHPLTAMRCTQEILLGRRIALGPSART